MMQNNSLKNQNGNEYNNKKSLSKRIVRLGNPHLNNFSRDVLYHIGLDTGIHDLEEMFGDVQFVCMGGTQKRMEAFAYYIKKEIGYQIPTGTELTDICQHTSRYCMYKIGPVLSVSHGMGIPSINILLHELIKLMHHAKCNDPIFFRIGTSGGIGLKPGTVVVSNDAVDGMGNCYYEVPVLGKPLRRPCVFDKNLVEDLTLLGAPNGDYEVVSGTTMCAIDFYEGQGRLDGAFCDYSKDEKIDFLRNLQKNGVKNIEMEALALSALTHQAGIRAADVCVTLLDRLEGDQVNVPKEIMKEWEKRPQEVISRYIKKQLSVRSKDDQ